VKITTVGIDLAKNVFQIHAVDERGKTVLKKQLKREQMAAFFANMPPCVIGMEACGSAHHWARKLQEFGHTVRLMAVLSRPRGRDSIALSTYGNTDSAASADRCAVGAISFA